MKKKTLILSITIISVVIGATFIYWQYVKSKEKFLVNKAIEKLESDGVFCSQVLTTKQIEDGLKLLLFCNGRPMSISYVNDTIEYSFQALDWVEDTAYTKELRGCSLYKSEKIEDKTYKLYFYCKPNQIKTYSFDISESKMLKIEELQFSDVFLTDFNRVYEDFKECEFENVSIEEQGDYPDLILLIVSCFEGDFLIVMPDTFYAIQPPVLLDENYENAAKVSFSKSFGEAGEIENCGHECAQVRGTDEYSDLVISYGLNSFPPTVRNEILVLENEWSEAVKFFGKYFVPSIDFGSMNCYSDPIDEYYRACSVNGSAILINLMDKRISIMGKM